MTALSDPDFVATLHALAKAMEQSARDDWWIIGSAAVALHGGDPGTIADVDVIVSLADFAALERNIPLADTREAGKPMFLSERFGRWSAPPLDVEFMAGLKLRVGDDWQTVQPQERVAVQSGTVTLYLPDKEELVAILTLFGRDKDLRRAATLK